MHVGYTSLKNLVEEIKSGEPVYISLIEETHYGNQGVGVWTVKLMLQSPVTKERDETIRYCAMRIGRAIAPGGEPWPEEREKIAKRGGSAFNSLKEALTARGIRFREAVVAMPKDLVITHGSPDLLTYHKDRDLFTVEGKEQSSANV
jgi:hypothetical protein